MTNKKVVLVIILFIIFGLFIYSFANPLDEGNTNYSDKDNNSTSQNNNSMSQTNNNKDDDKDNEEVEDSDNILNDDQSDLENQEGNGDITQIVTLPSNNTSSSNKGNSNNTTSRPNGGSSNGGSSGNNGGTSGNNKPSGGNNGSTGGNPGTPVTPPPVVNKQSGATISHIKYATEESDIGVLRTGNVIEFGVRMLEQTPYDGYTNYIKLRIMSVDTFSAEELKNASITVQSKSGIIDLTDGLRIDTSTNHAYVDCEYVFQKINDGNVDVNGNPINFSTFNINVNWGYGKEEVYTVILKIEVIKGD